jgi:hypothetical protein
MTGCGSGGRGPRGRPGISRRMSRSEKRTHPCGSPLGLRSRKRPDDRNIPPPRRKHALMTSFTLSGILLRPRTLSRPKPVAHVREAQGVVVLRGLDGDDVHPCGWVSGLSHGAGRLHRRVGGVRLRDRGRNHGDRRLVGMGRGRGCRDSGGTAWLAQVVGQPIPANSKLSPSHPPKHLSRLALFCLGHRGLILRRSVLPPYQ